MSARRVGPDFVGPHRPATPMALHVLVLCAAIAAFSPLYSLQALYPVIVERFEGGVGFAASLLTATTLVLAAASLVSGRAAAAFGARATVLWALIGTVTASVGVALADGPVVLVMWRIVQGATIAVGLSSLISSLATLSPSGSASLAASYSSGIVLGGLIGRWLPAGAIAWGWPRAFFAFAALQALMLVIVWMTFPSATDAQSERLQRDSPSFIAWVKLTANVLVHDIPAIALGGFVLMVAQASITTFLSIRVSEPPFSWPTQALGALYLVFAPALVAVRVVPGAIARFGAARTLLLTTTTGIGGVLLASFDVVLPLIVGMCAFSSAVFAAQTVFAHLISTVRPEVRNAASSAYLSAYYLGASFGSVAPVAVWKSFGWPGIVALVIASVIGGAALALVIRRRQRSVLAASHREEGI